MPAELIKPEPQPNFELLQLEKEIAQLEKDLQAAETKLNAFTSQIRIQLQAQILRIRELTEVYKKQKAAKKAKRLEQKKKGKNYREPTNLKKTDNKISGAVNALPANQQELKRLYKDAIRQVHPDKFATEDAALSEKANQVTIQLNEIYDSGDLEELQGFYEHIISGNAMSHVPFQPEKTANPEAMLTYLKKKQQELKIALTEIRSSQLFEILVAYHDPLTFIPELRQQFENRIQLLKKRTRIRKGNK